jgi:poly(glycerol-phosphate) alpha-glucosyltransferase
MFCPSCDDPSLEKLRHGTIVARRHAPAGDSSDEQVVEAPLGAPGQIVHLHGVTWDIVHVARCLRQRSLPYVMTSHGALHYHGRLHFLKKFIVLNFLSSFARRANGIHFLSHRERRRFRWLVPGWSGNTVVIPTPAVVADPSQVMAAPRTDFAIPPDDFLFLYLGRIDVRTKGLDVLLHALSQTTPDTAARLAIVGPDWEGGRARLEVLAQTLGCADRVHFLGPQYGAKKWAVLKMADAFVSPSRWEAFGIALVEAIGFGVPTITSTKVNLSEDLAQQGVALVSELSAPALASAMREMARDATLRSRLHARGREWVLQTCDPKAVGRQLADFYRQVLQGR